MPKYDLAFRSPLLNAAGSLGFAPDPRGPVDLNRLGAFVTNPVSLGSRSPAQGERLLAYPGGFLLHTGYPNPGLKAVLRRHALRWQRGALPVLVHLIARSPAEVSRMVGRLEGVSGVMGVELGLPPSVDASTACALAGAAAGELPLVVRLPLEQAVPLAYALAAVEGIAAYSLAAPRGALPDPDGRLVHGRMYGPGIFPLALETVWTLAKEGLPVIGAGGIYMPEQAASMLAAGAMAVQLDVVLWRGEGAFEGWESFSAG